MPPLSSEELNVLSTLAYYQALGVPSLTAMEILRYWTPWPRLVETSSGARQEKHPAANQSIPSFWTITQRIDALVQRGAIQKKNGHVALFGEADFFDRRIEAKKQGIEKRRICIRFTRILPYIPYVRMFALTGSLATDNSDKESDIDILVGSEAGHIWTTRILVTGLFQLLGKRRHDTKIKNRICLNHYIALDPNPQYANSQKNFRLLPEALTTAHIYAQALPLWGLGLFHDIKTTNPWLRSYIGLPLTPTLPVVSCAPKSAGMAIKNYLEKYLFPFWNILETWGGALQKKHILRKLEGKSVEPLEVLVGDDTLLFHYPLSRSKYVLTRYRQRMKFPMPN